MRSICAALLLLAGTVAPLCAQGPRVRPVPASGERIRVTPAAGPQLFGTVAGLGGDALVLRTEAESALLVLVSAQPVEIHRRHREHWSGLGALAGGALGIVVSQLARGSSGTPQGADRAIVSAAGGAVAGGLVGFSVAPHRWQPLRVPPPPAPAPAAAR